MPIKWSAVKVAEACDDIQAQLTLAKPFVAEAKRIADEARQIPSLPQYIDSRLCGLSIDLTAYIERLESRVDSLRGDIPADALTAETNRASHGNQESLI